MKNQIRNNLLLKRKQLSKKDVIEKSDKIKHRLFDLDEFKKSKAILFYVSYDNEVFTHKMIKESQSAGKQIIVPFSDKENRCLILSELKDWDELMPGSYGILEPSMENIREIRIDDVDLVIVPGVGFDKKGRRIGHGFGYYDNLLKRSNAYRIGLAFEAQIVDKIPTEDHDLPVHKIITEDRIINCRN